MQIAFCLVRKDITLYMCVDSSLLSSPSPNLQRAIQHSTFLFIIYATKKKLTKILFVCARQCNFCIEIYEDQMLTPHPVENQNKNPNLPMRPDPIPLEPYLISEREEYVSM